MAESRRSIVVLVLLVLGASAASQWWAHRMDERAGQALAERARPGDILMLSSDTCGFCDQARRYMTAHRIPFAECSIERDAACAGRFRALAAPGTPVMVVRGEPQLGFDAQRVLKRLES